jgi:hypothetical protein
MGKSQKRNQSLGRRKLRRKSKRRIIKARYTDLPSNIKAQIYSLNFREDSLVRLWIAHKDDYKPYVYAMISDEEVISYVLITSPDYCEGQNVGTYTRSKHRGKGYAEKTWKFVLERTKGPIHIFDGDQKAGKFYRKIFKGTNSSRLCSCSRRDYRG